MVDLISKYLRMALIFLELRKEVLTRLLKCGVKESVGSRVKPNDLMTVDC